MYLRATKQNWVKFLTLKALAANPPLCYRFSMASTSSKAGIKRRTNHFACKTNHLASIVLNQMLMLGNQANVWARAWPKMAVCLQLFLRLDTWFWCPVVLVKTRVWVGCSVSRAHKTWSRSFLFKDFPFLHCDLALVSDLFFPKIAPKSVNT